MKIVFLDRDGVINEFPGNGKYVTKVKNFHFIPRVLDALKLLTDEGFTIFVVSNQAGVGKGVYSKQKLDHIHRNMMRDVKAYGAKITKAYYCTHRSDAGCDCRKPGIGHVKKGLKLIHQPMSVVKNAFFVGDTESDILAGHNAGCHTILSLSGREDRRHMRGWNVKADYVVNDLWEAAQLMIEYHK